MKRFFRSLLAKYMLIILMALFIIQITYLGIALFLSGITNNIEDPQSMKESNDFDEIEENWHDEARGLQNVSGRTISQHFAKWKNKFPKASMFWIDQNGMLEEKLDVKEQLPAKWTPAYTAQFIKARYEGDPFTVIAFVGKEDTDGFIVFEIPRSIFNPPLVKVYDQYGIILILGVIFIIFVFITISFLFFRGIRKRLLQLQDAMALRDVDGLPIEVHAKKQDEIGQLEQTFNQMVLELRESRQREQEEERLRKELISNLSHDLRTPLTKISAQTYSIAKEDLSPEGKHAVHALETSLVSIDRLIENLMSYTLLMTNKYQFESKEIDVVRFVRECVASWYPVFEKEGFEIDIDLHSFEDNKWMIDPTWLERILDNLFQNVLRHAKSGRFIAVKTVSTDEYNSIVIIDRGKGMENESNEKGAGIGLSIVDIMIKDMELDWDIESSENGTIIKIKKNRCI